MLNYQEIIVYSILGAACFYAGYKLYGKLFNPLKGCNGCESDCGGCQLQDLKKEIEKNKKRKEG